MEFNKWLDVKPEFDAECVCVCADWYNTLGRWDYTSFLIIKQDSYENENEYYYGLCEIDGDEIDDLSELRAEKYFIIPLLENLN